jgi:hypothetical protein
MKNQKLIFSLLKKFFKEDFRWCKEVTRKLSSSIKNPLNAECKLANDRIHSDEKNPFDAESKLSSYRFKNGYDRKH